MYFQISSKNLTRMEKRNKFSNDRDDSLTSLFSSVQNVFARKNKEQREGHAPRKQKYRHPSSEFRSHSPDAGVRRRDRRSRSLSRSNSRSLSRSPSRRLRDTRKRRNDDDDFDFEKIYSADFSRERSRQEEIPSPRIRDRHRKPSPLSRPQQNRIRSPRASRERNASSPVIRSRSSSPWRDSSCPERRRRRRSSLSPSASTLYGAEQNTSDNAYSSSHRRDGASKHDARADTDDWKLAQKLEWERRFE